MKPCIENGGSMVGLVALVSVVVLGAVAGWLAVPAHAQDADERELERDLSVAQKSVYQLGTLQVAGRIEVDISIDHRNRTYAIGEPMHLTVRPHRDAYITVVDVGTSGHVSLLYPNHFQESRRVRANTDVEIPAGKANWDIKVGGPPGVDLIQVIASVRPLSLPEIKELTRTTVDEPIVSLGRSAEDFTRDLIPQLKPIAEERPREEKSREEKARAESGVGVHSYLVRIVK